MRERRKKENRQRAIEERKCFGCGEFSHMAIHCRRMKEEEPILVSSNKFEVLKVRVMQRGKGSRKEVIKDRREILREEKAKRGVEEKKTKKKKKKKVLREVTVKIGLNEEFARRHKFRRTKLERPVYVRNVDGMLNYVEPIVNTMEVEIFFRKHKKRTSIDVIRSQKWSVILDIPWLRRHNPEID